ncbi:ribonuclease H-like domain-containing protein [Halopenitus sp. H-Gu1]|uniref:ribonuclease H-like domain-containing protein n=1 Tax=Halopenitus sp. H-Gu1 TaxID=3242697 RepID=UPI00359D28BA
MSAGHGARLLALRCDALAGRSSDAIVDLVDYFDPDLVYIVREKTNMRVVTRIRRHCDQPVIHSRNGPDTIRTETVGDVSFAFIPATDFIDGASTAGDAVPDPVDFVAADDLEMTPDAVSMDAALDGLDDIARHQARTEGATTYLSGSLEASYDYVWRATPDGTTVRLPVRGIAPLRRSGAPEIACLSCDAEGRVAVTSVPSDRFGLQAVTGVGTTMAHRLKENGYETRSDIARTAEAELRTIRGVGKSTARTIRGSARALAEGRVIRQTDASVPAGEYTPLFVDIETDGLSPTIIWLIGVYDPTRDEYTDFVDTTPSHDEPGHATRDFVSWLASEYERPSLITWNGHQFDYKHLSRFIAGYASDYSEYWGESVFEYDLYDWAVRKGNAILPGRTNRLEDVAEAVGRDRDATAAAVDGKTLARTVQRVLQSPDRAGEVDWNAARAYCEADVRELAAVYDAIVEATPGRERADVPTDGTTTQTGLLDF